MTDGCNHFGTMKNGSGCETEPRDKNITSQNGRKCVILSSESGARPPSLRREPSQSPPVKNDRQGDKTNYADGDMWLTGCRGVDQTDRSVGTGGKKKTQSGEAS